MARFDCLGYAGTYLGRSISRWQKAKYRYSEFRKIHSEKQKDNHLTNDNKTGQLWSQI